MKEERSGGAEEKRGGRGKGGGGRVGEGRKPRKIREEDRGNERRRR